MKKCPRCGSSYEDVYTMCSDGERLVAASDIAPLSPEAGSPARGAAQQPSPDRLTAASKPALRQKSHSRPYRPAAVRIIVFLALILSVATFSAQFAESKYPIIIAGPLSMMALAVIVFACVSLLTGGFTVTTTEEIKKLPEDEDSVQKIFFYLRCGRWACATVVLFWVFFYYLNSEVVALKSFPILLMYGLLIASLILSLIALWGAIRCRAAQIVGAASTGLVFSGLFLYLFAGLYSSSVRFQSDVVHKRENSARLQETAVQLRGDIQQMMDATNPEDTLGAAQAFGRTFNIAAAGTTGHPKRFLEAMSRFANRSGSSQTNLYLADKLCNRGMDMAAVGTLQQMQDKRALVLQACGMMETVGEFEQNAQKYFRAELQTARLPPEYIEQTARGAEASTDTIRQHGVAVFAYAQSRRAMANLLESGWGKWTFHEDQRTFAFTDATFATEYETALTACKAATEKLAAANAAVKQAARGALEQRH